MVSDGTLAALACCHTSYQGQRRRSLLSRCGLLALQLTQSYASFSRQAYCFLLFATATSQAHQCMPCERRHCSSSKTSKTNPGFTYGQSSHQSGHEGHYDGGSVLVHVIRTLELMTASAAASAADR